MAFTSKSELSALKGRAFSDPQNSVLGVTSANGLPTENLRVHSIVEAAANMVQNCSAPVTLADGTVQDRFTWERDQALEKAKNDPNHATVPVEFAISFGEKEDRLAFWAHKRAILSESNPGYSIIPIGPKGSSVPVSGLAAYYVANHDEAKDDYIKGKRCFFDTVKITEFREMAGHYYDFIDEANFSLVHMTHYMFYGWSPTTRSDSVYGAGNYGDSYPNRLFSRIEDSDPNADAQIVKLYVADIRSGQFSVIGGSPIVQASEGIYRGAEVQLDMQKQFDIRSVYRNVGDLIRNLSRSYTAPSTGEEFAGMEGAPQLVHNVLHQAMEGTVLAAQYTPIVLDLGRPQIRTSDTYNGTLFNMSATKNPNATGPDDEYDILEVTSWLGGELTDVQPEVEKLDHYQFPMDVRRIADDGFLALPDADGQIRSSKNLFGDNIEINGQSYDHGFLALQAYAKKDCKSVEVKDRYLGPWDPTYKELRIWVDANRNGKVDNSELSTLEEAGVAAMNTCNVVSSDEKDAFGNGTALRSAFLFSPHNTLSEEEILHRIATGMTSNGADAEFRVMIDLIFQTKQVLTSQQASVKN